LQKLSFCADFQTSAFAVVHDFRAAGVKKRLNPIADSIIELLKALWRQYRKFRLFSFSVRLLHDFRSTANRPVPLALGPVQVLAQLVHIIPHYSINPAIQENAN
jgi:hypothetical protein